MKKKVLVQEKKFDSDTDSEIGSWFRFPILKPGFVLTLTDSTFLGLDKLTETLPDLNSHSSATNSGCTSTGGTPTYCSSTAPLPEIIPAVVESPKQEQQILQDRYVVCPKLFFCKHLSLMRLKNYVNSHKNFRIKG